MKREHIVDTFNTYLKIDSVDDYSYNGLQFEGCSDIDRIGFAVDAGIEVFQEAVSRGVQMLVVHHGLFWKKQNPVITGVHKKRLKLLWDNDISLYAAHLPLDMHDFTGNNTGMIRLLDGDIAGRFSYYGKDAIGAVGTFKNPRSLDQISAQIAKKLNTTPKVIAGGEELVQKIAVMSGACNRTDLYEAASLGADLLITGEQSEMYHDAHDYAINVIFAGHHASETIGIMELKMWAETQFSNVESLFIECPTEL